MALNKKNSLIMVHKTQYQYLLIRGLLQLQAEGLLSKLPQTL